MKYFTYVLDSGEWFNVTPVRNSKGFTFEDGARHLLTVADGRECELRPIVSGDATERDLLAACGIYV